MGRKHGFRGTPVRPPRGPATIGRVFEQRGDPMVSAREGREKYGRNLDTEDPDFDRYFAEDRARERAAQILKPSQLDKGNAFRKSVGTGSAKIDPQRKALNIVLKMNADMRRSTVNVAEKQKIEKPTKGNWYFFTKTDSPLPDLKKRKKGR